MAALEAELPTSGRILEIGCGHGLFSLHAAQSDPGRRVVGCDIDAAKLVEARRAARAAGLAEQRLSFRDVPLGWEPEPGRDDADAIVVLDVLYLLGTDAALSLVRAAARAVAPGGWLLVKEMDRDKRAKAAFCTFQELLATRVARVTEGEEVELVALPEIERAMHDEGLAVARRPMDRHSPWPHALVAGTRPT
jgi:cyclopropane fatty-acyl-phospholipid synthase-like methyltransferase